MNIKALTKLVVAIILIAAGAALYNSGKNSIKATSPATLEVLAACE